MSKQIMLDHIKKYRFDFKHLTVLFIVLIGFQLILSYVQKSYLQNFMDNTQQMYQQNSAENLANLTATSLELLVENYYLQNHTSEYQQNKMIEAFNIIFSQQLLQHNVEEVCLLLYGKDSVVAVDDGHLLNSFIQNSDLHNIYRENNLTYLNAKQLYYQHADTIRSMEQTFTYLEGGETFHIFVPFVPNGEFLGVLYMKKHPHFSNITEEIIASYDEAAIIYSSLIFLGLLAMYFISSYTVRERDEAQQMFFDEHEEHVKEQIVHEKESLFTKRIYHTHHKAEKVMGFIKEDLRNLRNDNIDEIKHRVTKYSNFISRVIYDMKWFDPPVHTIRNQMFSTDVNEVIQFIIDFIFLRISSQTTMFTFKTDFDESVPPVHINEFVVWEIFEPIIQNSIDHATDENVNIKITTKYNASKGYATVKICDDGLGIDPALLENDHNGVKKLFHENISTKQQIHRNSGYGCYIAYQLSTVRCGWKMDAENNSDSGCCFTFTIPV